MEDIISMSDMQAVFSVTDGFGIDRESIRVELTKVDPGSVARTAQGYLEVTLPLSAPLEAWLMTLKDELARLGYAESPEE